MSATRRVLLVGGCGALPGDTEAWSARVEVRRAATAAEGLALQRAESADVVAVDLDLPDGPAEAFCESVRAMKSQRRVSLIVVCGPDEDARRRAADCQANAHIVRPPTAGGLAAEIERYLAVPQRARYRVLAQVRVGEGEKGYSFFCTSQNLSATGILLETDEALAVGQELDCSFFLPGRFKVSAQGRVVREAAAPGGRQVGVRFVELSHGDAEALGRFVETWGTAS
jgi:DNA-binding response OmpR family regulator